MVYGFSSPFNFLKCHVNLGIIWKVKAKREIRLR